MSDWQSPCGKARILCGDAKTRLAELEDGSVQCVVTSPPYDDLRTYSGFEFDFHAIALALKRILCPGGVICWNVGDAVVDGSETLTSFKQAIHFKEILGLRVHDTMIWHKPNFSNPERVRYHQLFEYVFVFSKGPPRVFNPIKDKPNKYPQGPWGKNTYRLRNGEMAERDFKPATEFGMRGNVWTGNTVGQESPNDVPHPAMMPVWLAKDLIRSWSDPGDVVLDPMLGSGTTSIAAIALGRQAVGIDVSPDYCRMARERIETELAQELLPLDTK